MKIKWVNKCKTLRETPGTQSILCLLSINLQACAGLSVTNFVLLPLTLKDVSSLQRSHTWSLNFPTWGIQGLDSKKVTLGEVLVARCKGSCKVLISFSGFSLVSASQLYTKHFQRLENCSKLPKNFQSHPLILLLNHFIPVIFKMMVFNLTGKDRIFGTKTGPGEG